jgi:hypothetical protein
MHSSLDAHLYEINYMYSGQSQSINKVPTRFDVYIKGNRNDIFAARGADIAILTGFGEHLFTKVHGFISNN